MHLHDTATLEFHSTELYVKSEGDGGEISRIRFRYNEHKHLRNMAQALAQEAVTLFDGELFFDVCGRCGKCCREREILLSSHDIQRISLFFDAMPETEFRETFTLPAVTWNACDGLVKKKGGACAFLETTAGSRHRCAIYPVRPFSCESIPSTMALCDKRPEFLIPLIEMIACSGDETTVTLIDGRAIAKDTREGPIAPLLGKAREYIGSINESEVNRYDRIICSIQLLIEELGRDFAQQYGKEKLMKRYDELEGLINDLDCIETDNPKRQDTLAALLKKAESMKKSRLDPRPLEDTSLTAECRDCPGASRDDHLIRLFPENLIITEKAHGSHPVISISYKSRLSLLLAVREFISSLLAAVSRTNLESLCHLEPDCNLCGECCRIFHVEITPPDIERIADHKGLTMGEVRERFMEPGKFSWNRENALLKATVREGKVRDCIFLGQKSEGVFLCEIYEARPQICRSYSSSNRLCARKSLAEKAHIHLSTVISLDICDETAFLTTYQTYSKKQKPFAFKLGSDGRCAGAYTMLKSEITALLGE
ncbi:MAG: YkgJ family cysteine cluster protein [Candidatus Eremiobacteraeota bacterium]|nr:YkgJ family cysteine cluster protein [Candidatus Eremiobacteraeota bacterium]